MVHPLPKFAILGGCGFIGRHLVHFLLDKSSKIFVIDKTPPEIAWLNEAFKKTFEDPRVVFQSANLITQKGCERAFDFLDDDVDYVINLASETRIGQSEAVYNEGILKLSQNVLQQTKKKFESRLKKYVEVSTGAIYSNDKARHKETDKIDPISSFETKFKYQVEQELPKHLSNYVIIRPAIVYGPGDRNGITPRILLGAIYKHLKEMMKLPWNADLKVHTIHVEDLARAIHHLCLNGLLGKIYNAVDEGDTTQGLVSELISDIFDINHDFLGSTLTSLAKLDWEDVIEDANEKHMGPWAVICQQNEVFNTPLSPYITRESLSKRNVSLCGENLKNSGFNSLQHPKMTKELLLEVLNDFIQLNMFPASLLK